MQQIISAPESAAQLPAIYNRKDAAKYLKISVRKLDYLIASGDLAAVRIDKRTLISSSELLSFIERKTTRRKVQ